MHCNDGRTEEAAGFDIVAQAEPPPTGLKQQFVGP